MTNENIICISTQVWNELPTRKQFFMEKLASYGNRILYIEPLRSFMSVFKRSEISHKTYFKNKIEKRGNNIYVLSPCLVLPVFKYRIGAMFNYSLLLLTIKYFQRVLNFDNSILWVYPPAAELIVARISKKMLLYDCIDDYAGYPFTREFENECEKRLCKQADLVIVTAESLKTKLEGYNNHICYIPNGVNLEMFKNEGDIPGYDEKMNIFKKPIIGYVGGIYDWLDLDLIEHIAKRRPEWAIVIIGPKAKSIDMDRFAFLPNVHIIGKVSYELVPHFIRHFDVGIIPFKINKLTASVNPLKAYEYLAAGKPVVSTYMSELEKISEVIYLSSDFASFENNIEKCLEEDDIQKRAIRINIAEKYSWDNLTKMLVQNIEDVLTRRNIC